MRRKKYMPVAVQRWLEENFTPEQVVRLKQQFIYYKACNSEIAECHVLFNNAFDTTVKENKGMMKYDGSKLIYGTAGEDIDRFAFVKIGQDGKIYNAIKDKVDV